jgi:hypothetical protein
MVCLIRELALHGPGLKSKYSNKMQRDINDHESLVAALKQVDVVISTLGTAQLPDQLNLITAIKEVGHIMVCQCLVHNLKHLLNFVTHIAQARKKIQGLKCRTWGVSLALRVSGHSEEYHGWVDYPTQGACNLQLDTAFIMIPCCALKFLTGSIHFILGFKSFSEV